MITPEPDDSWFKDPLQTAIIASLIGMLIGSLIMRSVDRKYYDSKYSRLRSEIRLAADVDISYPYGDDRLNKSWFDEEK